MPDVARSLSALQTLLADNITGEISPQDARDFLVSVYHQGGPALLVAASDSPQATQDRADYVCDGTADEVQIQAALNALPSTGGTVQLSDGTFTIAASIVESTSATNDVTFMGQGASTIIKLGDSLQTRVFDFTVASARSRWVFRDFYVDGNKANQTGCSNTACTALYFQQMNDCKWDNIIIQNAAWSSLRLEDSVRNRITRCRVDGSTGVGIVVISNCDENIIAYNRVGNTPAGGDTLIQVRNGSSRNIVMGNTCVEGTDGVNGINLQSGTGTSRGNLVIGNTVLMDGATSTQLGISCSGDANLIDTVIEGNYVQGGDIGVSIGSGAGPTKVNGNTVYNADEGIRIQNSGNTCTGNTVRDCTDIGIHVLGNRHSIVGNTVSNSGTTVANRAGIRLEACSYVVVVGNNCFDDQGTKTQVRGIRERTSGTENVIVGNNANDNVNAVNIQVLGAATKAAFNAGYATEASGAATITNTNTSVTVTHGLDITPAIDDISIIMGEDPDNDPVNAWVDTITSTQFNINCGADPGASGLDFGWRVLVLQGV